MTWNLLHVMLIQSQKYTNERITEAVFGEYVQANQTLQDGTLTSGLNPIDHSDLLTVQIKQHLAVLSGFTWVRSHPLAVPRKKHGTILKMVSAGTTAYFYKSRHGATIMFMRLQGKIAEGRRDTQYVKKRRNKGGIYLPNRTKGKAETG